MLATKQRNKPSLLGSKVVYPINSHSDCNRDCLRSNRAYSYDPTRTLSLRKAWVADFNRRFKKIRSLIWEAIVVDDVFGLLPRPHTLALPKRVYEFRTSREKVDEFMVWLQRQVDDEVLGVSFGDPRDFTGAPHWNDMYIDSSYKQGIRRANAELKKVGIMPDFPIAPALAAEIAFNRPIHADRVGLLYTRAYNELKGVTDAMAQQMSRVLAQGMAEGKSPRVMARELMHRIEKVGDLATTDALGRFIPAAQRARMIARTEIVRAHHVATINTYREAGVEGVRVLAEWTTAGDDRVCTRCLEMEGRIFTLDEIEPMIPLHPQCRCVAIPAEIKVMK